MPPEVRNNGTTPVTPTRTAPANVELDPRVAAHNVVRLNSMGPDVVQARILLANWDASNPGRYPVQLASQVSDQAMVDIVKRFQAENGLKVDGVIGEQTWSALYKVQNLPPPGVSRLAGEAPQFGQTPQTQNSQSVFQQGATPTSPSLLTGQTTNVGPTNPAPAPAIQDVCRSPQGLKENLIRRAAHDMGRTQGEANRLVELFNNPSSLRPGEETLVNAVIAHLRTVTPRLTNTRDAGQLRELFANQTGERQPATLSRAQTEQTRARLQTSIEETIGTFQNAVSSSSRRTFESITNPSGQTFNDLLRGNRTFNG